MFCDVAESWHIFSYAHSIMAGFALEGVDYDTGTGLLNISAINEYRGQSYAIGGDEGAVTVANFVQHYNSNAKGASLGYHSAELCYGIFIWSGLMVWRVFP